MFDILFVILLCIVIFFGTELLLDLPHCSGDTVRIFNYDVTKRDRITELEKKLEDKTEQCECVEMDLLDSENYTRMKDLHEAMKPIVDYIVMQDVPVRKIIAYLLIQYKQEYFNNVWMKATVKDDVLNHARRVLLGKK